MRQTTHIGLHLYEAGDAANLRDQYNLSMQIIDKHAKIIYDLVEKLSAIDIDEIKDRVNQLEIDLADLENRVDTAETNITDLQNRVQTIEQQIEVINSEIETINSEIEAIKTSLDSVENRLDDHDSQLEEINSNLQQALTDIDNLESRCAAIETNVTELQTNVTSIQENIDSIEEEITIINTTVNNHETRLLTVENDIDAIEQSTFQVANYLKLVEDVQNKIYTRTFSLDDEIVEQIQTLLRIYPAMKNNLNEVYLSAPHRIWYYATDNNNIPWGSTYNSEDNTIITVPEIERYSMLAFMLCRADEEPESDSWSYFTRIIGFYNGNGGRFGSSVLEIDEENDENDVHPILFNMRFTVDENDRTILTLQADQTLRKDLETGFTRQLAIREIWGLTPMRSSYNWLEME